MTTNPAREAAVEAALERVRPGMTIGLGSGRAVFALADAISARYPDGHVRAVVASPQTHEHVAGAGIEVIELDASVRLDLAIDGADEVDPNLALIKGGGAALLREKLVMAASPTVIIVAEAAKQVSRLGETRKLPIEVVRFGWETTRRRLQAFFEEMDLRRDVDGAPAVTDEGHYLLDATLGSTLNLIGLATDVKNTLGVVDHGLFIDQATEVLFGHPDGVVSLHKR